MKILIVDDEPSISDTLAYCAEGGRFVTNCCTLGNDALVILHADRYDLVVLDIGLPDMSGFDVCRALRRYSDVPVIFLTARADEVDRIVGLELGADDYVTKPFSPREVVSPGARHPASCAARHHRFLPSRWLHQRHPPCSARLRVSRSMPRRSASPSTEPGLT